MDGSSHLNRGDSHRRAGSGYDHVLIPLEAGEFDSAGEADSQIVKLNRAAALLRERGDDVTLGPARWSNQYDEQPQRQWQKQKQKRDGESKPVDPAALHENPSPFSRGSRCDGGLRGHRHGQGAGA